VTEMVGAAQFELIQLEVRAGELALTLKKLSQERHELSLRISELAPLIDEVSDSILREVPSVQAVRKETKSVIERKVFVGKSLALVRRREALVSQRAEIGVSPGYDSSAIVVEQHLDGATLNGFCEFVERELLSWDYPAARRIFFEIQRMDISLAGKSRSANGKGVRALLHGAFAISLMKFAREKGRVHAGFLALDSLFITYRDPDDPGDIDVAASPLRDRAFQALSSLPTTEQLIVLENVDVPDWLMASHQCIHFSGQPNVGRAGFFPTAG